MMRNLCHVHSSDKWQFLVVLADESSSKLMIYGHCHFILCMTLNCLLNGYLYASVGRQTPQDLDLCWSFVGYFWPSNTAGLWFFWVIWMPPLAVKHRRTSLHVGFLIRGRRTAFFTESSKLTTLRDPLHIKDNRVSRQIPQEDDLILCLPAAQWQLLRSELQTKNILFAVLEVV